MLSLLATLCYTKLQLCLQADLLSNNHDQLANSTACPLSCVATILFFPARGSLFKLLCARPNHGSRLTSSARGSCQIRALTVSPVIFTTTHHYTATHCTWIVQKPNRRELHRAASTLKSSCLNVASTAVGRSVDCLHYISLLLHDYTSLHGITV